MKKIITFLFFACIAFTVSAQNNKSLPEDLWGLKMGKTGIDMARNTVLSHGLKITTASEDRFQAEGHFSLNGIDYHSIYCVFVNNKLGALLIGGTCDDAAEINTLFSKQFNPLMSMRDSEREDLKQYMGMQEYDLLIKEDDENLICLFTQQGTTVFVLSYMWNNGIDEMVKTGGNLTSGSQDDDVTKFMGIPVDGTYADMRQKLIKKGFKPSQSFGEEVFEGEFNGDDVIIMIGLNKEKVHRIFVLDDLSRNAGDIIIRYNNLLSQFVGTKRYVPISGEYIGENEDVEYEMQIKNKRYQSYFIQRTDFVNAEMDAIKVYVMDEAKKRFTEYDIQNNFESKVEPYMLESIKKIISERSWNTKVWMTIVRVSYGKYKVAMYYDNPRNMANGEDL